MIAPATTPRTTRTVAPVTDPVATRERPKRPALLIVGLTIVGVLVLVALLAPLLAPYSSRAISGASMEPPSSNHLLGTNDVGQDIFSQVVWGARSSLGVGLISGGLTIVIGLVVGVGAGLRGGVLDTLVMRAVDVSLALPIIPFLIVIAALAGPSQLVVIIAITAVGWRGAARLLRSQTLSLRQRGFVVAARGFGGGQPYVIRRHLAPALGPLIVTHFVQWVGVAIGLESVLAFLGLGDPSRVSWGQMINRALQFPGLYFTRSWIWWLLPPGVAISIAILGFALLGVALEPVFNRRTERNS